MSHWEGFGTLLMVTDTSNALPDPVLYGAYTVCQVITKLMAQKISSLNYHTHRGNVLN